MCALLGAIGDFPTDENGLGVGACVTVGLVALPEHPDAVFEE